MRWLALLLLSPLVAFAQPTTWPANNLPLVFKVDSACYAYGWRGPTQRHVVAGPHSAFVAGWREIGLSLMTGTDAERAAAWSQHVTGPIPAVCHPLADQVHRALYVPQAFVVAPAASNANPPGTRPAFPFANGVRGTTSNGRATSGEPCNCAVKSGEFCGVNGRADQVALCVAG